MEEKKSLLHLNEQNISKTHEKDFTNSHNSVFLPVLEICWEKQEDQTPHRLSLDLQLW